MTKDGLYWGGDPSQAQEAMEDPSGLGEMVSMEEGTEGEFKLPGIGEGQDEEGLDPDLSGMDQDQSGYQDS